MNIVVDANLLIALVTQHPRRQQVYEKFEVWADQNDTLHAPDLAYSEVTNALTRIVSAGLLERSQARLICAEIAQLSVQYHSVGFDAEVIDVALTLGRKNAYDAVYLVLAKRLDAQLWTLDTPLYRNAVSQGYSVYLIDLPEER
jgi:predicted nucleic acid-binding protein